MAFDLQVYDSEDNELSDTTLCSGSSMHSICAKALKENLLNTAQIYDKAFNEGISFEGQKLIQLLEEIKLLERVFKEQSKTKLILEHETLKKFKRLINEAISCNGFIYIN